MQATERNDKSCLTAERRRATRRDSKPRRLRLVASLLGAMSHQHYKGFEGEQIIRLYFLPLSCCRRSIQRLPPGRLFASILTNHRQATPKKDSPTLKYHGEGHEQPCDTQNKHTEKPHHHNHAKHTTYPHPQNFEPWQPPPPFLPGIESSKSGSRGTTELSRT